MFSLALVAGFTFVYALVSKRLASTWVSAPMLFMAFGLVVGPQALDLVAVDLDDGAIQLLLEGTLVIVLFSDAALIDFGAVRKEAFLPERLLGIGLPLTILSGLLGALVLSDQIGFWEAAVIAIILAPTDAALGQAVVSNRSVPAMVRQGLSVESGLNDGIAVPFLTIAIAGAANEMQTLGGVVEVFVAEIGGAIVAGLLVGWLGALAIRYAGQRGWMTRDWRLMSAPVLALGAFAAADPIGGSGFIAAFVAGITFGQLVRAMYPDICDFSEGISHLLTATAFFVFGALILGPSLPLITWQMIAFGIASLTVVRMVPVALALIGTGLRLPTVLYIGWFGPRGLASLVFAGTVVVVSDPEDAPVILAVVSAAVAMSVLAHGATAVPWSRRYAAWFRRKTSDERAMPESDEIEHMPVRKRISLEGDHT
ncbi:MAG: sodium:proton antiporter [Actinomycetota bacterium]